MDNPQQTLSDAELGWIAGILDGEGSILLFFGVRRSGKLNNVSPQVIVGNTEQVMIETYARLVKQMGAGVHISTREPKIGGIKATMNEATMHRYKRLHVANSVGFQRVRNVLRPVTPFLVTSKRQRAELILRFIDQRLARREVASADGRGTYSNAPYDREDLELMVEVLKLQRSKHTSLIEGMLRDYTRGRPQLSAA